MKAFLSILSVVAITFCLAGRASAQDPVKVAPKQYKAIFNNDRVRVLEITIKPGEKSPMHSHPDYLIYAMGPAKAKFTGADGKTRGRVAQIGSLNNFCTPSGGDLIKGLSHDGTTEERARTL